MTSITGITTERLMLAPWMSAARASVHAMHNTPEVQHFFHPQAKGWSEETTGKRIAQWEEELRTLGLGKFPLYAKDGAFVGRAGFSLYGDGAPELGYSLDRAHWNKGYASEIARGLRDWFFENRADDHFIAFAHVDNAASLRVLDKIGMRKTHIGDYEGMPHHFWRMDRPAP